MSQNKVHPALSKSDPDLLTHLFVILSNRVKANAYSKDGSYADAIRDLPKGLRTMAATHHLDISLALDDIGWHFLNFGEPNFVRETENGLYELGLPDLAGWFSEAHHIVAVFLQAVMSGSIRGASEEYYRWLKETGNAQRIDTLTQFAWDKSKSCSADANKSAIYESWIRYARLNPEAVLDE